MRRHIHEKNHFRWRIRCSFSLFFNVHSIRIGVPRWFCRLGEKNRPQSLNIQTTERSEHEMCASINKMGKSFDFSNERICLARHLFHRLLFYRVVEQTAPVSQYQCWFSFVRNCSNRLVSWLPYNMQLMRPSSNLRLHYIKSNAILSSAAQISSLVRCQCNGSNGRQATINSTNGY